jgi:hypothetical protein
MQIIFHDMRNIFILVIFDITKSSVLSHLSDLEFGNYYSQSVYSETRSKFKYVFYSFLMQISNRNYNCTVIFVFKDS